MNTFQNCENECSVISQILARLQEKGFELHKLQFTQKI